MSNTLILSDGYNTIYNSCSGINTLILTGVVLSSVMVMRLLAVTFIDTMYILATGR